MRTSGKLSKTWMTRVLRYERERCYLSLYTVYKTQVWRSSGKGGEEGGGGDGDDGGRGRSKWSVYM